MVVEHLPGFCRAGSAISSTLEEMKKGRREEGGRKSRRKESRNKIDASPLLGPFETQFCKPWY